MSSEPSSDAIGPMSGARLVQADSALPTEELAGRFDRRVPAETSAATEPSEPHRRAAEDLLEARLAVGVGEDGSFPGTFPAT